MPRLTGLLTVLVLAGCAVAPRSEFLPPQSADLFVSPAGEPFHVQSGASPLRAWFDAADADHDGRLSLAEFTADHRRFFDSLDLDHDGVLSDAEIGRYETVVAPEILSPGDRAGGGRGGSPAGGGQGPSTGPPGGRGGGPGGRGGGRGAGGARGGGPQGGAPQGGAQLGGAARFGLLAEPEPVRAADTNFDFRVTADEWEAAAERRFDQLDLRHQGVLSLDEWVWPRR